MAALDTDNSSVKMAKQEKKTQNLYNTVRRRWQAIRSAVDDI